MSGSEAALGLTFADRDPADHRLPKGAILIGYSSRMYFCFFRHYEQTVFAVTEAGQKWHICPIAYNFEDFLRLIAACGCAELCARSAWLSEETYLTEQDVQWRKCNPALKNLREALELTPIKNPYQYTHTIAQIIDCSRIDRN